MFYSQFILAKKGPLGTIWIAAHLERKLRKNQVADTDIGVSVDSILFPEMPIALRLSSHLLLGVVRIYSRKVNYLFDDCSEALLKIKQAFRSTAVDLPPEESTAPYHSITLPETFDLDDFELPDSDIFHGNYVDHHISSRDQITLQDTMEGVVYSTSKFGLDERFGDGDTSGLDLDEVLFVQKDATVGHADDTINSDATLSLKHDEDQGAATVSEATPAGVGDNQMEDFDGDNEPVEYAQAPCTPGLWEEPNLSNIQETSACDDHQDKDEHSKESGYFSGDQEHNQSEPLEKSHPAMLEADHTSMNDLDLTSVTDSVITDQARPLSPKDKVSDATTFEPDGHDRVEDLPNGNARDKDTGVQSLDDNRGNCVELQGGMDNEYHPSAELEPNGEPLNKDSMLCSTLPVIRPCRRLNDSDASVEISVNPDVTAGGDEHATASGDHVLLQGEVTHSTDPLEQNMQEIHVTEHAPQNEFQEASDLPNEQVGNVVPEEVQLESANNFLSDLPAPEKLLSVPEGTNVSKDLLLETPAQVNIAEGGGGDSAYNMLTGKKRSYDESSLVTESVNLDKSSGLLTSNITAESVPDDDDLLSSILVGRRSSVLKMKPTLSLQKPSTKRRRSAPRTRVSKRKVLMDDNMVLHGDTIRQQLINTEDIRRLRKKAPCTRPEISMIQRQFLEDELFNEAIFTGVSMELASLHHRTFDLSKIRISQNDEIGKQLEARTERDMDDLVTPNLLEGNGFEANLDPVLREDICDAQPIETPLMFDNQPCENNAINPDLHDIRTPIHMPSDVEHDGQRTVMDTDGKTISDVETESFRHATDAVSNSVCDMSAGMGQFEMAGETDASLQLAVEGIQSDEKVDLLSVEFDPSIDIRSNKNEDNKDSEIKDDVASVKEISEEKHEGLVEGVEILRDITDGLDHDQVANIFTSSSDANNLRCHVPADDQEMEDVRRNEEELLNPDAVLDPVDCSAKNLASNGICDEEFAAVSMYDAEINLGLKDVSFDGEENPETRDKTVEDASANDRIEGEELEYSAVAIDTDFLNFDDDEDDDPEVAGDYATNNEATRLIDNSGWSSRTKAVAKYLQNMFDKEAERGRNVIPMNNLLVGKTRKEASRMFFETLVLKTKDYIHVEQKDPFGNIGILPRSKLWKSDF